MLDLDLDIALPRLKGRSATPATVVRALEPADLEKLGSERGTKAPDVVRISDRHHALARILATGVSESEAAFAVGISLSRVSILKTSPAFQDLLEFYRKGVQEIYEDMHSRLASISMDSAQILLDRLEDDPESIPTGQLIELVKMGADRTGFGPQTTSTNINIAAGGANRLDEARKRVEARRMKDITPPKEGTDDQ